jgi:hypothetical protein
MIECYEKKAKPAITGGTRLVNRKLNSASVTPVAAKVWPRAKTAQNRPESVRTRELARKGLPSFFDKARCKIVQYLYVRALRFSPLNFLVAYLSMAEARFSILVYIYILVRVDLGSMPLVCMSS